MRLSACGRVSRLEAVHGFYGRRTRGWVHRPRRNTSGSKFLVVCDFLPARVGFGMLWFIIVSRMTERGGDLGEEERGMGVGGYGFAEIVGAGGLTSSKLGSSTLFIAPPPFCCYFRGVDAGVCARLSRRFSTHCRNPRERPFGTIFRIMTQRRWAMSASRPSTSCPHFTSASFLALLS